MPSEKDLRQADYLRNRISKNEKRLRKWARTEGVEALRLYDNDIPEVPLSVDRYGDALLIALYERPYEKDEELEEEWLELMSAASAEALGIDPRLVFRRTRKRQRGQDQYERYRADKAERIVRESGLSFIVNLSDYLDTGLFLDHRPTRAMVRAEAPGKDVLNLFCYTGSFSVYAAAGKAASVTSVDLSKTYLEWAERNLALNGAPPSACQLERADVRSYLSAARERGRGWDLIVADPPTFSNSKSAADFDVNSDWPALVADCIALLRPGGRLYFSTNSRKLRWKPELLPLVGEDISAATIPPDFRDARMHRCWRFTRE
jgi:23S rRNA G2069 N7-methylase RlmK/C1962 C5-methylase RlmI